MRILRRNTQKIYYALYTGKTAKTDSLGYATGEYVKTYGTPVEMRVNINPASGNASVEPFGTEIDYTHIMVTCDTDCPIDEHSILWIGKEPYTDDAEPQLTPHNFRVNRVAKSLNSILYAIREVDVSVDNNGVVK